MGVRVLRASMFFLLSHFLISDSSIVGKPPSEAIWQNEEFPSSLEFASQLDTIPIINPTTPTTTTPIINPPSPTTTTPTYNPMPPPATTTPTTPTPTTTTPTTPTPTTTTPTTPTPTTTTPGSSGGSWCIASPTASDTALQVALDYACGYGGADCSAIQPGAPCYNPNTLRDHASYAFNDYYQKNPVPTSCAFGGTAQLTNNDPSSGSCRFSKSKTTPSMSPPVNPSPTFPNTPTGYGSMPSPPTFDGSEPTGYGSEPTATPNSANSMSFNLMLLLTTTGVVLSAANYF